MSSDTKASPICPNHVIHLLCAVPLSFTGYTGSEAVTAVCHLVSVVVCHCCPVIPPPTYGRTMPSPSLYSDLFFVCVFAQKLKKP